jgi:hypothetical protein
VHAFLLHLEKVGFDGAPVVRGTDDAGREILTFIEGDVLAAGPRWRPGNPTPWPSWAQTEERLFATAPHNTVYRAGLPVAFIDWDTIQPNDPIVEFGAAAWKYVSLGDDVYFEASDFPARPALTRRLAVFAQAYGIHDRDTVRWALHQAKQRSVDVLRYFPITPVQGATELRRVANELEWLDSAIVELLAELD